MLIGRSPREVARTLSLAEIIVTLDRADYRRTVDLLAHTRSRYLASGAKWSGGIGGKLREFMADLYQVVDSSPPKRAKTADLAKAFGLLGIQPQS